MKEIGEYLRQVRTEKNISLEEIQETTKVRKHYLEAIENGDFEAIPGEVYRKGFLVSYANAIGLDSQEILARYNQVKSPPVEAVVSESKKTPEPVKKKTRIYLKNSTNLWVFISIILAVLVAYFVVPLIQERTIKLEQTTNIQTSQEKPKTPLPTDEPKQDNEPSPSESPEPTAPPETVSTQIYPAPVMVTAEFSEDVWVQVIKDGVTVLGENGQVFSANSPKQVWTAQKELKINIGNPAGIQINLNGQDLGKIGDRGIRKIITLTPEGLVNQSTN